jgi:hypothetical protein
MIRKEPGALIASFFSKAMKGLLRKRSGALTCPARAVMTFSLRREK